MLTRRIRKKRHHRFLIGPRHDPSFQTHRHIHDHPHHHLYSLDLPNFLSWLYWFRWWERNYFLSDRNLHFGYLCVWDSGTYCWIWLIILERFLEYFWHDSNHLVNSIRPFKHEHLKWSAPKFLENQRHFQIA